jgi:hypothetical protein
MFGAARHSSFVICHWNLEIHWNLELGIFFCNRTPPIPVTPYRAAQQRRLPLKMKTTNIMQNRYFKIAGAALVASALVANVGSAPLQRADVPANPAWVVHVDCDAIRPTAVGQFLLGEMAKPENKAKISVLQSLIGIDIATQLHGLTLYNSGTDAKDGVLIVYADFDADKLNNLAQAAKDPESTKHHSITIRSWVDDKKSGTQKRTYGTIKSNRVILGQQESTVAAALDVLDGGPSLAGSKNFPQLGAADSPKCIQAAAHHLDVPGNDPHAAMLKFAQGLRLDVGESEGKVKATLALEAKDGDVAQQMYSVAQGLLALGKLQNKPETAKLVNALSLKQDSTWVVANLNVDADDLVEAIKTKAAQKAEKKAEKESEKKLEKE